MSEKRQFPRGSRVDDLDLSGVHLHGTTLEGARLTETYLMDADISGDIEGLRLNGVEVEPLVRAELDRLYPDRVKLRAGDVAGLREAWSMAALGRDDRTGAASARGRPARAGRWRVEHRRDAAAPGLRDRLLAVPGYQARTGSVPPMGPALVGCRPGVHPCGRRGPIGLAEPEGGHAGTAPPPAGGTRDAREPHRCWARRGPRGPRLSRPPRWRALCSPVPPRPPKRGVGAPSLHRTRPRRPRPRRGPGFLTARTATRRDDRGAGHSRPLMFRGSADPAIAVARQTGFTSRPVTGGHTLRAKRIRSARS